MKSDGIADSGMESGARPRDGSAALAATSYGAAGGSRFVSALCRAELDLGTDGIAVVRARGLVTRSNVLDFKCWVHDAALAHASAVVVDCREVVLGVGVDSLTANVRSNEGTPPLALITSPEAEPAWREWAWQRALEGTLRSVFRDERRALDWARARAWFPRA